MERKRIVTIEVPEILMTQIELLMQLNGESLDDVIVQLLSEYKDRTIKSTKKEQTVVLENQYTHKIQITPDMIKHSYEIAKKVYFDVYTVAQGKEMVHKITGMKEGSAQDYINDFRAMMDGEVYRRTMSADATEYFLRNIYNDYGRVCFEKAVSAVEKHVEYYKSKTNSPSKKILEVVASLKREFV